MANKFCHQTHNNIMNIYGSNPVLLPKKVLRQITGYDNDTLLVGLRCVEYSHKYHRSNPIKRIPNKFKTIHKHVSSLEFMDVHSEDHAMFNMRGFMDAFKDNMVVNQRRSLSTNAFNNAVSKDKFTHEAFVWHKRRARESTIYNMSLYSREGTEPDVHNYKYENIDSGFRDITKNYRLMTPFGCRYEYMKSTTTSDNQDSIQTYTRMCILYCNYEAATMYASINLDNTLPNPDIMIYMAAHLILRGYRHPVFIRSCGVDVDRFCNTNNEVSRIYMSYLKKVLPYDRYKRFNYLIHKLSNQELTTTKTNIQSVLNNLNINDMYISTNMVMQVVNDAIKYNDADNRIYNQISKSLI